MDNKEISKIVFLINEMTKDFLRYIDEYYEIRKNSSGDPGLAIIELEDRILPLSRAIKSEKIFHNTYETLQNHKLSFFANNEEKLKLKAALEFCHKSYSAIMDAMGSIEKSDLSSASEKYESDRKKIGFNL